MHTFHNGPEFCFMVRKLFSSCRTSKNLTLEEQYPKLCNYLSLFPTLCAEPVPPTIYDKLDDEEDFNLSASENGGASVDVLLILTSNETLRANGFK